MTVRVLVADDQDLVRSGIAMLLGAQPDIRVVAEAADGVEAIALARQHRPDVCLVDVRMPGADGIEVTRQLAGPSVADPIPVVVITTFDLDEYVHRALRAGARGFLLKGADPALLARAVRAAADGDAVISPEITARLLSTFAGSGSVRPTQPTEPLTAREEEVLLAVSAGLTNGEVAQQLFVSVSTVKTHVSALMRKLAARNRVELVVWAYETSRVRGGGPPVGRP